MALLLKLTLLTKRNQNHWNKKTNDAYAIKTMIDFYLNQININLWKIDKTKKEGSKEQKFTFSARLKQFPYIKHLKDTKIS